jgi:hypothetical protein
MTAIAVLPVLVLALILRSSVTVLLALVLDGSISARFSAEWWRARGGGTP